MQKKYKYLAIAIFLCVICTMAITITYANTNALTKVQITNGTAGINQYHASDVVEWRIHVHSWLGETNSNPNLMTNLTIIDVLPNGETFAPGSNWTSNGTSTFTVTNNGTYNQILKWDFGNFTFQADPEVEVHYNVTLFSNLPDGTFLINEANWSALVWDPYALHYVPQYASGEDSITVVATPSTIRTSLNTSSPITVGTPFQDSATLTGFISNYSMANDNANVTFYWSTDNITWTQLGTPISAPWNGGSVNSIPVVGLGSGTYYFKANYTGNFLYKPSDSVNVSEIMVITPTYSTTTTLLNNTSIVLGGTVHDTANVTFPVSIPPYPVPTGTVTFTVQWPNGTWKALGTASTVWDNNTKQYYAVSADFTPLQTGTYHFNATYSGDSNYNGSYGTFDSQNEILNVTPATPTVTTLLNTSTITLGQAIYDNATVTGLGGSFPIPTGFALFQNNDTGSWVTFANVTLVNGKATSTSFTPAHTGTFYFQAVYSGDGNYTSVTSNPATEILTVNKAPSTTTTQLNTSVITLGQTIYDNATVTGSGPVPTGFALFQNNDTGSWVTFANVTLVNGVASFANFTPLHVGTFYFQAVYSGDSNYQASTSSPATEIVTVNKASSSTATLLNNTQIVLGGTVHDTANVTFPVSIPPYPVPTGTVTFSVEWPNGTWVPLGTVSTVWDNNTKQYYAVSADFKPLLVGTYYFNATYSGDSNYNSSTSSTTAEVLGVTPATPTVTTLLNTSTITLGQAIYDNATVTGLGGSFPIPTGFALFQNNDTGSWVTFANVTLVNGKATSTSFTPAHTGTFYFQAVYSGDGNYTSVTSNPATEILTVGKIPSTVTTQLNASTITLGLSVYDNATVTGSGPTPTGFVLFYNNDTGSWVQFANVTLVNGVASFATFTPTHVGLYYFNVTYSGDSNYNGSILFPLEVLNVTKAVTSITTNLNSSTITLGSSIYDNATVTYSGPTPTGFVLFQNNDTGTWVTFSNVTLVNGKATSSVFTPLHTGTFYFQAVYSGDGNYLGSTSNPATEVLNVTKGPSQMATYLNTTTIVLGNSAFDTANVTFFVSIPPFPVPTGTITFQVEWPNGTWQTLGTVTGTWDAVNNRFWANSPVFTPTQTGTYYFNVTYSGDGNYTGSNELGNSDHQLEVLVVNPATPLVQTIINATSITLSQSITDKAIIWGLPNPPYPVPTGNVTFWYNGSNNGWVYFDNETLVNGVATSMPFTPPFAGIFYFKAIYIGDGNYTTANSGELSEQLVVQQPTPTIVTTLSSNPLTIGSAVYDNATISGYGSLSLAGAYIQFWYMAPGGTWTALGLPQLVTNANGGTFSSIYLRPNTVGNWDFMANYTGNNNYLPGASANEPLSVQQATPCVSTNLSAVSITLGTWVYDNATVTGYTGLPLPTGTVTFQYNITGSWVTYDTETLVNGMVTSIPFTPTQTGTYHLRAVYSGDAFYIPGTSGPDEEFLIVNVNPTTIVTTTLNATTTTLGTSIYDTAMVIAPPNSTVPTGTVTFFWELSGGSWAALGTPVNLTSGVAQSPTFTPNATGTYYFSAFYSGDSKHNNATSTIPEILTITPATPGIQTLINGVSANQTITLGQTAYDKIIVWGLPSPPFPLATGTVQFYWELSGGSWNALGSPVTLAGASAVSPTFQPNATGTYYFLAVYSGDSNYVPQNSSGYPETLTVNPSTPAVATWLTSPSITLGQSVTDNVIVWGLPNPPFPVPTGTVQFYWELSGGSWNALGSPVSLVYGIAVAPTFQPNATGTYYFKAVYSGDTDYNTASSSVQEVLTVGPATPGVQTILNATNIVVNQSVTDNAIVWGLPNPPFPVPTGTIQFYWELSGGSWNALGSPVTLASGSAVSPTFTANQTGTYYFMAAYSGDSSYNATNSGTEVLTVNPAIG